MDSNTQLKPLITDHDNLVDDDLLSDIQLLREKLDRLTSVASHNEQVMARCHERELSLLATEGLETLIDKLTNGLEASFELEEVSLTLLDPYHVMRDLLRALGIEDERLPKLRLVDNLRLAHKYGFDMKEPMLGAWHPGSHGHLLDGDELKSIAVIPLRRSEGPVGCLNLGSNDASRFTANHATDFLERLGSIATVCLENATNRERLRLTGLTDPLTGLYNRRYLEQRLEGEIARCSRHGEPLSCLFVDADHFKRINDTHGHTAGDYVLIEIARRLRMMLRSSDLATRYGGEEFALILPHTLSSEAMLLAERIRDAITDMPFQTKEGTQLTVTVSVGVSELTPLRIEQLEDPFHALIDAADTAVYQAKADGRNCVRLCEVKPD